MAYRLAGSKNPGDRANGPRAWPLWMEQTDMADLIRRALARMIPLFARCTGGRHRARPAATPTITPAPQSHTPPDWLQAPSGPYGLTAPETPLVRPYLIASEQRRCSGAPFPTDVGLPGMGALPGSAVA